MNLSRLFAKLLLVALLMQVTISSAQDKVHRDVAIWPELQADYVFKSTSYLYFRNQYRHNLNEDLNHLREQGPLKQLERAQLRVGYEHMFRSNLSAGISEAYAIERTRNILFNEVFVRHSDAIGKFRFTERATVEHIVRWGRGQENSGRVRLRADLDHAYTLAGKNIRPRISYELFRNIDYTPDEIQNQKKRSIDRTRLRAEIVCALNNHWTITPYYMKQTDYFVVQPSFDVNGTIIRLGGKQNHITPILGFELRYTFFQGRTPFPRVIQSNK